MKFIPIPILIKSAVLYISADNLTFILPARALFMSLKGLTSAHYFFLYIHFTHLYHR